MGVQYLRVRVPYHETGTIVTQLQEETALRLFCQMTARTRLKRKEVDDVLGGDDMWKHADSTAGQPCSPALSGGDTEGPVSLQRRVRSATTDELTSTCSKFGLRMSP